MSIAAFWLKQNKRKDDEMKKILVIAAVAMICSQNAGAADPVSVTKTVNGAKPIPQELLAKFPAEDIRILLPAQNVSAKLRAKDPDANQGYALVEPWNGKKFAMGTYSSSSKQYGPSRMVYPVSIVQGKYALYKLNGSTKLTPDMIWWGGKWGLILKMGQYCKHDNPESLNQKWDIYISLKFTDDKVYVDRGFLVKAK